MRRTTTSTHKETRETHKRVRTKTLEYLTEEDTPDITAFKYFVGIDPSYSSTGFVVLDEDGVVLEAEAFKAGKPGEPFCQRLQNLLDQIRTSMVQYDVRKMFIVMEGASFASEFNAFKLGKLSGVLEYFLGINSYKYALVAPTFAKKVATGTGAANKFKVMQGVQERWGFVSHSDDIVDAYVMAQIARGERPIPKPKKRKRDERKS